MVFSRHLRLAFTLCLLLVGIYGLGRVQALAGDPLREVGLVQVPEKSMSLCEQSIHNISGVRAQVGVIFNNNGIEVNNLRCAGLRSGVQLISYSIVVMCRRVVEEGNHALAHGAQVVRGLLECIDVACDRLCIGRVNDAALTMPLAGTAFRENVSQCRLPRCRQLPPRSSKEYGAPR